MEAHRVVGLWVLGFCLWGRVRARREGERARERDAKARAGASSWGGGLCRTEAAAVRVGSSGRSRAGGGARRGEGARGARVL
jgi:hypothetical protein